jgi:menaquinone-dependent protoporphyrinogen IX oxidase
MVGYALRYSSTREGAEIIAATLREVGLEVDIRPTGGHVGTRDADDVM